MPNGTTRWQCRRKTCFFRGDDSPRSGDIFENERRKNLPNGAAGKLPVICIGKIWRLKKDMVDNWLLQHTIFEFDVV